MRTGIRNAVNNLNEPVVLANNLLQLRFLDAGHTLMRFYLNSTVGLLGVVDIATPAGIERRTGDFGQTLAALGVPDGPFLMLPLLGLVRVTPQAMALLGFSLIIAAAGLLASTQALRIDDGSDRQHPRRPAIREPRQRCHGTATSGCQFVRSASPCLYASLTWAMSCMMASS